MKMEQILFLVLVTLAVALGDLRPGLRTKFGKGDGRGTDYYLPIPQYVVEALVQGWTKTARPGGPLPSLDMYCPPEMSVCALFDSTGYVAGLQHAFQKDRFSNAAFDWRTQGYTDWTVNGVEYWAMPQFFVDEKFLKINPEDRIAKRDSNSTLQLDSIWLTSFYGELLEIPVKRDDLDPIWSQERCITGMGHHQYYNATNTVCASDLFHPWFTLYYGGRLMGTLWMAFGEYPVVEGQTDWFERPDPKAKLPGFPDASQCFLKLSEHTIRLHNYFVDNPWDVICDSTHQ